MSENSGSKYFLATFGCQMNIYDSNMISRSLEDNGFTHTDDAAQADLILVNTCSVREGAEERAIARIASMRQYKKRNKDLKIAVIGCMAQNRGEGLLKDLEHVDFVIGPDNYNDIPSLLKQDNQHPRVITTQDNTESYPGLFAKNSSPASTMITIMRGCNKNCAYCIVPHVRGRERSRPPGEIEKEITAAVASGVREVILLGQTVNAYRTPEEGFAQLLYRLNDISGLKRIRFTSSYPTHFTPRVIKAMAECEKVCRHVHIPVQSGSTEILKQMRRAYSRERYLEIISRLKGEIPHIGLSTDIMTGYPGETQKDFEDTLTLVKQVEFDSAFTFSYSPREGTPAFEQKETLSTEEKKGRLEKLISVQNQITTQKVQDMVGKQEDIMLEGLSHRSKNEWIGKTSCFKKVLVPAQQGMRPGQCLLVKLTERRGITLAGNIIKE